MIKVKVVCVGRIKEDYLNKGLSEYIKRLSGYCKFEIIEVKDEKIVNNIDDKIKDIESKRTLEKINDKDYVILLDLGVKELNSNEFAEKIDCLINDGVGNICFVIGGSLGVSEELRKRANFSISFSKMTFTHQMVRLLLLEQIYRAFKIINHETYHK